PPPAHLEQVAVVEHDRAAAGALGQVDQLEQGALAGAGVAGEEQHLARRDVETDLGERDAPTGILLADAVETQDGHGREYRRTLSRQMERRRAFAGATASRTAAQRVRVHRWSGDAIPDALRPSGLRKGRVPPARHGRRSIPQCWLCGARVTSLRKRAPMREISDGSCTEPATGRDAGCCARAAGAARPSRGLAGVDAACPLSSAPPSTRLPRRRRRRLRGGRDSSGMAAATVAAASITGLDAAGATGASGASAAGAAGAAAGADAASGFGRDGRRVRGRSPSPPERGPRLPLPLPARAPRPPPRLASSAARASRTSR